MNLENRVALVTGAGQGVGRGIAQRLHDCGATVVIAEYNVDSGQAAADAMKGAAFVPTDVTQREQVEAAVQYAVNEFGAPENAARLLEQNPMGRMGDPAEDVGGVVAFLASQDARYLTGNTLFVDGGSHINGVNWDPMID